MQQFSHRLPHTHVVIFSYPWPFIKIFTHNLGKTVNFYKWTWWKSVNYTAIRAHFFPLHYPYVVVSITQLAIRKGSSTFSKGLCLAAYSRWELWLSVSSSSYCSYFPPILHWSRWLIVNFKAKAKPSNCCLFQICLYWALVELVMCPFWR